MIDKKKILNEIINFCDCVHFKVVDFGIVQHPLFSTFGTIDSETKELVVIDNSNITKLKQQRYELMEKYMEKDDGLFGVFLLINKPWRLQILNRLVDYMDTATFSDLLSDSWQESEFPHDNPISTLVNMFKKSAPAQLMDKIELEKFQNLPDKLTVYRGLQDIKAKIRGLSWTYDIESAKWFANRWKHKGTVYQAEISKEDIFAVFLERNEHEVVLNPYKLKNIKLVVQNG